MLKKFALALTATTICIDVESAYAITKEEREENRSSIRIKRRVPQMSKPYKSLPLSLKITTQTNTIKNKQTKREIRALKRVKYLERILKRKQTIQQKQNVNFQLMNQKRQIQAEGSNAINTIVALKKGNIINYRNLKMAIRSIRREVNNRMNTVQRTQKIIQSPPFLQAEVSHWGRKEISLSILGGKSGKITLPSRLFSHKPLQPLFEAAFTRHKTMLQAKSQEALKSPLALVVPQKHTPTQKAKFIQQENKLPVLAKKKVEKPQSPSLLPVSNIVPLHKDPVMKPTPQKNPSPLAQEKPQKEVSPVHVQARTHERVASSQVGHSVGEQIAATALKVMTFLGVRQEEKVVQVEEELLSKASAVPVLHLAPKVEGNKLAAQNILIEKPKLEKTFQPVISQAENKVIRKSQLIEIDQDVLRVEPKEITHVTLPQEQSILNSFTVENQRRHASVLSKVVEQPKARVENKVEEILQQMPQIVKNVQTIEVNPHVLKIEEKEINNVELPQEQVALNLSIVKNHPIIASILPKIVEEPKARIEESKLEDNVPLEVTQVENKVEEILQQMPQIVKNVQTTEVNSQVLKIEEKEINNVELPQEQVALNLSIVENHPIIASILPKIVEEPKARIEESKLEDNVPLEVAQVENKIEEILQKIAQHEPNLEKVVHQELPIIKNFQNIRVDQEMLEAPKEIMKVNLPEEQTMLNFSADGNKPITANILSVQKSNISDNKDVISESPPRIKIEEITFEEEKSTLPEKEFDFLSTMLEDLQNRAEKQQSLFTPEKFESSDTGGELYLQSQRDQFSSMKDMYDEVLNKVFSLDEKIKKLNNKYLLNNLIKKLNNNMKTTNKALDSLELALWKNEGDTPTSKVEETPTIENNTFETTLIIQSNSLENEFDYFNGILGGLQKRAENQQSLFTPEKFKTSDTGGELYLQSQRNQSSDMKKMYHKILGEISSWENSLKDLENNSSAQNKINLLKDKVEETRQVLNNLDLVLKGNTNETPTLQITEKSSDLNSTIHFEKDPQVKEENSETTNTIQHSFLGEEFNSFNEILGGLLHRVEEQQLNFNPENFNNSEIKGDFYTSTQQRQFLDLQDNYNNYLEDVCSFDYKMNYFSNDNINYQNMKELKSKLEKIKNALDLLKDTLQVEKETPTPITTPTPTFLPSTETTQEEEIDTKELENVKRNTLKIEMEKIKSELEIVQNLVSFQKENFSPSKFGPVYIDYQNQFIDALRERLDMSEKKLNMILEDAEENSDDQNGIKSTKEKLIKIQENINESLFLVNNSTTQKNTLEDSDSIQSELSNNENSTPLPEKTTLLTEEEKKESSKHLKSVKLESITSELESLNAKIRNQENMFQTGTFGDIYLDYQKKMLEEFKNQSHVLSETLNELKEEDLSEFSKEIEHINVNFRINQLSLNIIDSKIKELIIVNNYKFLSGFQEENMDVSNKDSIKLKNNENQETPILSVKEITLLTEEETEETTNSPSLQKEALESINSELENLEKKLSLQKKNFNTTKMGTFYDDYLVQQKNILEIFKNDLNILSDNFYELIDKDPINNSQLSSFENKLAFLKKHEAFDTMR